jgi:hypothetical protein
MANILSGATNISSVPYYDPVTKKSEMNVLWGLGKFQVNKFS